MAELERRTIGAGTVTYCPVRHAWALWMCGNKAKQFLRFAISMATICSIAKCRGDSASCGT
ncbi:hypothetical protein JG688_00018008 [Phytophthora aleatoria]|uniref:Uncharacterized protein n=1 Tax=Phytophthora aleatoria TaxID=2496075 RepID=A0A8J5LY71_9STRA|nr:hypothetical protein JG688_00018008 [Phytophthora aleatoria]